MTKLTDLVSALQENGYPVAQMQWYPGKAPAFPHCTLIPRGTSNIFSENGVSYSPVPYDLNLFSEVRDIPMEKSFQALLESMGVPWQRDNYMRDDCVIAVYQITLIED